VAVFGPDGVGVSWSTFSLAIQPDDKIVLGGDYYDYPDTYFLAVRFNGDGQSLDTNFGALVDGFRTGYLTVDMGGAGDSAA
jgi:hypothetical protein